MGEVHSSKTAKSFLGFLSTAERASTKRTKIHRELETLGLENLANFRQLSPKTYRKVIDLMNRHKVLSALSLDSNTKSHLTNDEIEKVFDFHHELKALITAGKKESPKLYKLLAEFGDKVRKIAAASSSINQFQEEINSSEHDANKKFLLDSAVSELKTEIQTLSQEIQPFFHNYNQQSKTVDYLELKTFAQRNRRNQLFSGFGKIGGLVAAALISSVLAYNSLVSGSENPTDPNKAAVEEPAMEGKSEIEDSKLKSLDSNDPIPEASMNSNNISEPGKIDQGALVYTATLIDPSFLITNVYKFQGDQKVICPREQVDTNNKAAVQTIKLEPNNYQAGERIKLPIGLDLTISEIKTNKPCKFSLNGQELSFEEDIENLVIEYQLAGIDSSENSSVFSFDLETQAIQIPDRAISLQLLRERQNIGYYLSDFKYIISSELDTLINRMPGLKERNLSFVRVGDCDMLANHLAWALQDKIPCAVACGYMDNDYDGKVYQGNAHAMLIRKDDFGNPYLSETTSDVSKAFIFPANMGFKQEDLKELEKIVDQINLADNQNQRDQLMTIFDTRLDEILKDDYYKTFHPKNKQRIYPQAGSRVNTNTNESFSAIPNLKAFTQFNTFSAISLLTALWSLGMCSILFRRQASRDTLLDGYKLSNNPFIGTSQIITYIPVAEGCNVIMKTGIIGGRVLAYPFIGAANTYQWWIDSSEGRSFRRNLAVFTESADHSQRPTPVKADTWKINPNYEFQDPSSSNLNDASLAFLKSLISLKREHKIPIPDTYLERLAWLFNAPASLLPEYRPLWHSFSTELESLLADGKLTTTNIVDLMRKHFELKTARQDSETKIDDIIGDVLDRLRQEPITDFHIKQRKNRDSRTKPAPEGTFRELREYTLGDDIRRIDWNASARRPEYSSPLVKKYENSNPQQNLHKVKLIIDCQVAIYSAANTVRPIAEALKLSQDKKSGIEIEAIEIYSFGKLVKKIDSKDLLKAMSKTSGTNGLRDILKGIYKIIHAQAIYLAPMDEAGHTVARDIAGYSASALPVANPDFNICCVRDNLESFRERLNGKPISNSISPVSERIALTKSKTAIYCLSHQANSWLDNHEDLLLARNPNQSK